MTGAAAKNTPIRVGGSAVTSRRELVSAIVLAAGSSSRLGEPKPLVRLGDRSLLARVLDTLRATAVSEIVVVLGSEADCVRREIPLHGTRIVINSKPARGMSSSIRAGLEAASLEAEAFLIVLGDQPFVAPGTVDALLERRNATRVRILVPTYRGVRGNPVLLDRSFLPEMRAISGDVGCRHVITAHPTEVVEVPVDDPGVRIDVDTPEDLAAIREALRNGTPLGRLV